MKNNILVVWIQNSGNTNVGIHISDEPISREEFLDGFLRDSIEGGEDDDFDPQPMIESILEDFEQIASGENRSSAFRYAERVDITVGRKDFGE